ncbi:MAG: hypothetical protein JWQ89_2229 [Devosia sp.]|uniref:hypothetical protein n=1 Tax=Devosia sp. TaxID=1871048 RepID=UPI002607A6D9|nr:hypothetical protein [Devosia sp.]MDB5540502.1 hypothetical protein [Devosia sp.]
MPKVEFLDENKTLARWTFANSHFATQRAQFRYWCGWFGFDPDDQPHEVVGNAWLVRKHR